MLPLAYIRLAAFALLAGFLAFFAYKVHSWRQDSLALSGVRQEMSDLIAAQEASHKASQDLSDELQKLRTARKPAPVIRMCKPAKQVPNSGAGSDGPPPGAGELPQASGFDTQPLYDLADEADELAARLRACQSLHLKGPR